MGRVGGILGVLLLLLGGTLPAHTGAVATVQNGEESAAQIAIRAELDEQAAAWNRGDLKGYMAGYWHSGDLTFFAGNQESMGWEASLQRYRAAYSGKGKGMGQLRFSNIRIEMLSPEAAFVRGGWQLSMKDKSQRRGLFTVVLRKFSEGWRIVHDHSS